MPASNSTKDSNVGLSNRVLYSLMVLLILFGTGNTIFMKAQDTFHVGGKYANGLPRIYAHPYVQTTTMFVAQFVCLIIYFGKKFCVYRNSNGHTSIN